MDETGDEKEISWSKILEKVRSDGPLFFDTIYLSFGYLVSSLVSTGDTKHMFGSLMF